MAKIRLLAKENRRLREEVKQLRQVLDACHSANLIRIDALEKAGIPDPLAEEEE